MDASLVEAIGHGQMPDSAPPYRPPVVVTANSWWNLAHFRLPVLEGLERAGFRLVVVGPSGQPIPAALSRFETATVPIDRGGINPLRDLATIRAYRSLFRRVRPALAFSFTVKPNLYAAFGAKGSGVPTIPNVSGLGTAFLGRGALQGLVSAMTRSAFRRCPRVFLQNADDRAQFVKAGLVREEQAVLLPGSGIDLEYFAPIERQSTAELGFVFVGRLLVDKGVRELVEAFRLFRGTHGSGRLVLVGDVDPGNRSSLSQAEVESLAGNGVELAGSVDDVRPYLAEADAVVLPSYREGLPRSLLEASAMARPMIATDVPGCRDLVIEGETGLLCAPRDATSLADAMVRFAGLASAERSALGRRARAKVEANFGIEKVVDAYVAAASTLSAAAR